MAAPLAVYGAVSAGIGLYSAISGKMGADKLASQQKKLGKLQATMIQEETAETLRRTDIQNDTILSTGDAAVAASGFASGSSQDVYMSSMASEMKKQRDWTESSGKKRADLAKEGAGYTADAMRSQGTQSMSMGIGNSFNSMRTAGAG